MKEISKELLTILSRGDAGSFTALLLAVIWALCWRRFRQMKQLENKEEKIYKILDNYAKNSSTIAEAPTNLKMALLKLRNKL